jgi:hypothetical protein
LGICFAGMPDYPICHSKNEFKFHLAIWLDFLSIVHSGGPCEYLNAAQRKRLVILDWGIHLPGVGDLRLCG